MPRDSPSKARPRSGSLPAPKPRRKKQSKRKEHKPPAKPHNRRIGAGQHIQKKDQKAAKEKLESDYKAKEREAKENAAISKWALENGYSDEGAAKIVKYGGLRGKIKLSNDGRAEIGDDIKAELDNEWKGYKKPADVVDTAKFQKPPANDGNKSTMTKAEIMDIKDSGERQKAIAENPELFGIEKE